MKKIIILFVMAIAVIVNSADKPTTGPVKSTAKAVAKLPVMDLNLTQKDVISSLRLFCEEIDKDIAGKPISSLRFYVHRNKVKFWLDYPFLEADTEISREWFDRVYKMLDYMGKAKSFLENSVANRQTHTEDYKKMQANFNEVYRRFDELLKKPTPVEKKKLEKLREEKRKWELTQKRGNARSGSIKENE